MYKILTINTPHRACGARGGGILRGSKYGCSTAVFAAP